jgi:hypothetical protein
VNSAGETLFASGLTCENVAPGYLFAARMTPLTAPSHQTGPLCPHQPRGDPGSVTGGPWPRSHCEPSRRIVREAEPAAYRAVPVHHASDVDLRRPSIPATTPLSHSRPHLIGPEGQPETGADAGRSLQGARSAWPYRQSQRRAAGFYRTSIGLEGQASDAVTPAVSGPRPTWPGAKRDPYWTSELPACTAPEAAVAIEGDHRRSAQMSLLGNRAVPRHSGLLRIMVQRCKTGPRPRRGRREDRSLADGRFAPQR